MLMGSGIGAWDPTSCSWPGGGNLGMNPEIRAGNEIILRISLIATRG